MDLSLMGRAMKRSSDDCAVRSTYRVQLHPGFGFDRVAQIADYLGELGVSHLYASPYLQAAKGSTHGYDVVDYRSVNVELGGPEAHHRMCNELRRRGLGQVLDIVPNHMAAEGPRNAWWWDVLKHGAASRYARYFDIFWGDPASPARVLVPILGDAYGKVLRSGDLKLVREGSSVVVRYFEQRLPLSVESQAALFPQMTHSKRDARNDGEIDRVLAEVCRDPARLDELLEKQHYRLAFWRFAATHLNYRCFFDINQLVALRQEDEAVFDATHAAVLGWLADGTLDGVRIDHIDGLRDPESYLRRLRTRAPSAWIVVEKVLEHGETLPKSWPVAGTTGYEFLNLVGSLFVDPGGEAAMTEVYQDVAKACFTFQDIAYEKKIYILNDKFGSEIDRLVALLAESCAGDYRFRDTRREHLRDLLVETVACFPIYRTYVRSPTADSEGRVAEHDVRAVELAMTRVGERRPDIDNEIKGVLSEILLLRRRGPADVELVMQFQQLTGPVMAKGVEDTAFYRYYRLIALNEVGGDPSRFGVTPEEFHHSIEARRRSGEAMLASTTHDTKRSEDVRARIAVLSEIPSLWASSVRRLSQLAARHKRGDHPGPNTEYLFWQTIVGAHPIDPERAARYMLKACREAKGRTAWVRPDADYEAAVTSFVKAVLADADVMAAVEELVATLVEPGRVNALAQKLITLTAPGVPDIYQGTELWDLSLVDPDNRHPVCFDLRRQLLRELPGLSPEEILRRADEGLPKLLVVARALDLRRRRPALFGKGGSYEPLFAHGSLADHLVAFVRAKKAVTIVPRLMMKVGGDWQDTTIALPPGELENVFTGEKWRGRVALAELLRRFPVALLVAD
jgi:(1->4)-alpha-D-glucan 1-alpha-D-glucosylmutase